MRNSISFSLSSFIGIRAIEKENVDEKELGDRILRKPHRQYTRSRNPEEFRSETLNRLFKLICNI